MSISVLTRSYNNARTGANTQEATLTANAVATRGLHRIFSLAMHDDARGIEAQPLIASGVKLKDGSTHDVVYLCTMANNVFAFDANDGEQLWPHAISLGNPVKGNVRIDLHRINDHWGVLGTPVIDRDTETLYAVSWTSSDGTPEKSSFQLHALSLVDGSHRHSPLQINASVTHGGKKVEFSPSGQKQRAALLLVPVAGGRKTLFMACGSVRETAQTSHGWILAFDLHAFKLSGVFCATPAHQGGGIWGAGQGPAADAAGHIYCMTGNGNWDGVTDFSESFLKLEFNPARSPEQSVKVVDWFTPFVDKNMQIGGHTIEGRKPDQTNHRGYDWTDQDLGSGGAVVLESLDLVVGAGKDGILYVLDRNAMGKTSPADLATPAHNYAKLKSPAIFFTYFPGFGPSPAPADPKTLNFNFATRTHHLHGSPIFWESAAGKMLFCWGENGNLRAWQIDAHGVLTFAAAAPEVASGLGAGPSGLGGMPGGMLCLSADGNTPHTGVVWGLAPRDGDANMQVTPGILRAYDATQFETNPDGSKKLRLLWDTQNFGSAVNFNHNKFGLPVVANGKVYVPTYDGRVDVYALR